ncbi:MAG: shikimate dehydrogenase [Chloroflexota bacterium]
MSEDRFGFIIHPIDTKRDVSRKYPTLGRLPAWLIDFLSLFFPPVFISEITGVTSAYNGRSLHGWFVACPLSPKMMMRLPPHLVYRKIIQTGRHAEKLGARILGLGAFTSVVGDGGITVANQLNIPVTTGDSYTVATAVQAIRHAAATMNISLPQATVAIVGATGAIGAVCAQMLAPDCHHLLLIGRRPARLQEVAHQARTAGCRQVTTSHTIDQLSQAHLIITVTSAVDTIIGPQHLRPGAVVCDVARPRDVSRQVVQERPDVLVIEGGMVAVPGSVNFNFNFGFPPGMAYACMAETMALALEQKYESYTLGKDLRLSQVLTIDKIAEKHGFKLGGFRSFERAVTPTDIAKVKAHCQTNGSANAASPLLKTKPIGPQPL